MAYVVRKRHLFLTNLRRSDQNLRKNSPKIADRGNLSDSVLGSRITLCNKVNTSGDEMKCPCNITGTVRQNDGT